MRKLLKKKSSLINILWILSLLAVSCGKEEFKTNPNKEVTQINPTVVDSQVLCSDFTLVKPQVDFLFLWDNSASQYFVTPEAKAALNNIINQVSQRFDYRALIAPLVVDDYSLSKVNDEAFLIAENLTGVTGSILSKVRAQSDAPNLLNFQTRGGSREQGLIRAYDLVNQNINNGVFRKDSYTIVVLMSNGNENSYIPEGRSDNGGATFFAQQKANYLYLRDTRLNALQFRFMSVTAHSTCVSGFRLGYHYMNMSRELYQTSYPGGKPSPTDQGSDPTPDSYDICSMGFSSVFEGINSAIEPQLLNHVYNYWPITSNTSAQIDLNKMEVKKVVGNTVVATIPQNNSNGWEYVGAQTNRNTRIQPTAGEPFTGLMLRLRGSAKVTYPECLKVKTETPSDYYGFVHLNSNPTVNTINLKVGGVTVPESTTNGWQFVGFLSNHNIKIISPTNTSPNNSFPEFKTGYFLKINGQQFLEKFTNGASISIHYTPAAN